MHLHKINLQNWTNILFLELYLRNSFINNFCKKVNFGIQFSPSTFGVPSYRQKALDTLKGDSPFLGKLVYIVINVHIVYEYMIFV